MSQKIKSQWGESDIPSTIKDKVVFITGANVGLGYESARMLAERGARIVLACRNVAKAEAAKAQILALHPQAQLEIVPLDLADLESVAAVPDELAKLKINKIDVLLNNAGIMATPKRTTTKQGFELQFGTNHLAHFALTAHLFRLLSDKARIVNVSSIANQAGDVNWDDIQWEQKYTPMGAYRQSKTANLLFTYELNRRLTEAKSGIVTVGAHPGVANTNLVEGSSFDNWFWKIFLILYRIYAFIIPFGIRLQSAAMGALPQVYASTDEVTPGGYYGPAKRTHGHPISAEAHRAAHSSDPANAKRLWEISEKLTDIKFPLKAK